jgi:hypothetical protein
MKYEYSFLLRFIHLDYDRLHVMLKIAINNTIFISFYVRNLDGGMK